MDLFRNSDMFLEFVGADCATWVQTLHNNSYSKKIKLTECLVEWKLKNKLKIETALVKINFPQKINKTCE